MFTGIIETMGLIKAIKTNGDNLTLSVEVPFLNELKIDQSIAHNGVCLTIDALFNNHYTVTAIKETLNITNLESLNINDMVNIERCLRVGDRLDGHIVQGHVDCIAKVVEIINHNGSWEFFFEYKKKTMITVEKGSVCVNGVSLTVVQSIPGRFSVAVIPYTFEHTNFKTLQKGSKVNIEFDIVGKYILAASKTNLYFKTNI